MNTEHIKKCFLKLFSAEEFGKLIGRNFSSASEVLHTLRGLPEVQGGWMEKFSIEELVTIWKEAGSPEDDAFEPMREAEEDYLPRKPQKSACLLDACPRLEPSKGALPIVQEVTLASLACSFFCLQQSYRD